MNAAAVVSLLLGLLDRASSVGVLLSNMQAQGRNATPAEWDALLAADKSARDLLVAAIAQAKADAAAPAAKGKA